MGAPKRKHTPRNVPSRQYLVGLPVVVSVSDDGRVNYLVDTGEAAREITRADDWPDGVTEDIVNLDAARIEADHERRMALIESLGEAPDGTD